MSLTSAFIVFHAFWSPSAKNAIFILEFLFFGEGKTKKHIKATCLIAIIACYHRNRSDDWMTKDLVTNRSSRRLKPCLFLIFSLQGKIKSETILVYRGTIKSGFSYWVA